MLLLLIFKTSTLGICSKALNVNEENMLYKITCVCVSSIVRMCVCWCPFTQHNYHFVMNN